MYQKLTQDREPLVPFAVFRDRNFSVMNWVSGVLAVGMMGIFLPFTIYLQSVLGFSALKAGLAMAPASLISMFVAPVAGRMTDRIGGKYILMTGLLLFGGGMGWLALIAHPTSSWQSFLPPLIVAGFGMGCVFAPLITVAMRNVQPQLAGRRVRRAEHGPAGRPGDRHRRGRGAAAEPAGVGDDQPGGGPLGGAARAGARPVRHRDPGLGQQRHPGRGRPERRDSQADRACPPGLAAEVARIGHDVFTFGYVSAMRTTMLLPVVLLAVGALSCLALREPRPSRGGPGPQDRPAVADAEERTPTRPAWPDRTRRVLSCALTAAHEPRLSRATSEVTTITVTTITGPAGQSGAERARPARRTWRAVPVAGG